jgi:predicted dehydrogenase
MARQRSVRVGIIGVGTMGGSHAARFEDGEITRAELTAVCDVDAARMERFGETVSRFSDAGELLDSGTADAVIIATPHFSHTTIGCEALARGLHVLVEKPISVHKADCERLVAAHRKRRQVFAAMFNQRTDPHYAKVKELIDEGHLGELMRVNWTVTDWFRSEIYYAMGAWRATWKGEGGGVLLNQSPHQLDMLQWLCGMPGRVRAFCHLGKWHDIEVEDEVTAYMEFPNGATGVFITSTGEAPGTNRLELAGENGRVVVEGDRVTFTRNVESCRRFSRETKEAFSAPDVWNVDVPATGKGGQHRAIIQNFVDAILDRTPLIAPAREGTRSVELANAMLLSSLTGKTVDLPLNGAAFERRLKRLQAASKPTKRVTGSVKVDLDKSF